MYRNISIYYEQRICIHVFDPIEFSLLLNYLIHVSIYINRQLIALYWYYKNEVGLPTMRKAFENIVNNKWKQLKCTHNKWKLSSNKREQIIKVINYIDSGSNYNIFQVDFEQSKNHQNHSYYPLTWYGWDIIVHYQLNDTHLFRLPMIILIIDHWPKLNPFFVWPLFQCFSLKIIKHVTDGT